ncbi:MAG: hypothetical protein RIR62_3231 [Pseudomonadota bacterium]|jgi:hypothetical protein
MRALALSLFLPATLAACGPVSVEQAERLCYDRARLAAGPRGEVGLGIASDGNVASNIKLEISSDYIAGRDPSAIYDSCVYRKSGQPPRLPLYMRPDWRG